MAEKTRKRTLRKADRLVRILERFTVKHGAGPTVGELAHILRCSEQGARERLMVAREHGIVVRHAVTVEDRLVYRWRVTDKGRELL